MEDAGTATVNRAGDGARARERGAPGVARGRASGGAGRGRGMIPAAVELELLRRMSPAEKLAVMRSLIRQAYRLRAAALRATRPDLCEAEVLERTRAAMSGDRP